MSGYCSTGEAAERSGATYRQLDHWVRYGFVCPPLRHSVADDADDAAEAFHRKWDDRRWRSVDVAAASAVVALVASGPGREADLARLASSAVYCWHGRAPWVVVALPDLVEPAIDAVDVAGIVEKLTVATVIGLEP